MSARPAMSRLFIELRESAGLALFSIAAHKLRSGLTLLGVLVGVFSIILVMTAMRAVQNNIEHELGQLGGTSFAIEKMQGAYFGRAAGFRKFLWRTDITFAQAIAFKKKATFVPYVGLQSSFWSGSVTSRQGITPPNVSVEGATPGVFQASSWSITDGRALIESDVESARDVCVLSKQAAEALFP